MNIEQLWRDAYAEELEKRIRDSGVPINEWRNGGRKSQAWPGGENQDFWLNKGPEFIDNYIKWRESNDDLTLWVTPDGKPAVELGIEVSFGSVPVLMYVDSVFSFHGTLVVVDTKTGGRAPDSIFQLGWYATGIELTYGVRPAYGAFFMARKGNLSSPESLDRFSVPLMSRLAEEFVREIEGDGSFLPNPGGHCRQCGVNNACAIVGGKDAALYDPIHPDYRKELSIARAA